VRCDGAVDFSARCFHGDAVSGGNDACRQADRLGFAVIGAASVVGSMLVLLVAFAHGFTAALALGGLCYLAALWLFRTKRAW